MSSFLTELYKPEVSKSVVDESANVVLAACIAAVFLTKNRAVEIDSNHWLTMANYIIRGKSTVEFSSEETASDTFDMITLRMPMSDQSRAFIANNLTDSENPAFFMVESIIQFLNNNASFNLLVAQVTNNGVLNRVIVDIENIDADDPNMTSILVDNEHVQLFSNVMPVLDFQTGRGGFGAKELNKDYGYEAHRSFLNKALGLDIGPDSAVYYQSSHNNGNPTVESVEAATRQLYEELCRKINDGFNGAFDSPLNDFKHNIIEQMLRCCYGVNTDQDCTCLLMDSNGKGAQSFDVQKLYEKLYKSKLEASCPSHLNPSIRIVDKETKKPLFQLRFKKEGYGKNVTGHRYKMYFNPAKVNEHFD